jgi:uncharacterized protein (TIGR02246 family)
MTLATETVAFGTLYAQVQQFYAEQMHMLDDGDADGWAATFTEDGTFTPPRAAQPVRGPADLAAGVRRAHAERAAGGVTHRHWHGMLAVTPRTADSVDVRCYALVIASAAGGASHVHAACVCTDVLVRREDRWLVADRKVTRDGL